MDRGKGGDKPDFADLVTGKCKGRTSRDQVTFYRNVGNQGLQFSSVGGWVYQQAVQAEEGPRDPDRVVPAGHPGLTDARHDPIRRSALRRSRIAGGAAAACASC